MRSCTRCATGWPAKYLRDARGDRARDLRRVQFIGRRQQPVAVAAAVGIAPFAGVVELADHARPLRHPPGCTALPSAGIRGSGASPRPPGFRPGPCANSCTPSASSGQVMPILYRRMPMSRAACSSMPRSASAWRVSRYDLPAVMMPIFALRAVPDDAVQLVGARIGQRRVPLVVVHPRFLLQHGVRPADVQAARRQLEIVRQRDLHALRIELDRRRRIRRCRSRISSPPTGRCSALIAQPCRP